MKTVPQPPYSLDIVPCDFWLFPKLTGCRYETIEEMKSAVTKVVDTLTQEDFHGVFQKMLERYNRCIAARGDNFEGDKSFMCVLSIKVPKRKSLETYLMIVVLSAYPKIMAGYIQGSTAMKQNPVYVVHQLTSLTELFYTSPHCHKKNHLCIFLG